MHIYFIGIGGSGLSPLSQLAIDCGYDVSGSDIQESLGTKEIEKRDINVIFDQSGEGMKLIHSQKPIDWVVYSAACKANHPELVLADKLGIKKGKRHTFLNQVLSEKKLKLLAIAGTHGKTTTTAMVVWLFKKLNIPVSYLIGSNISFGSAAQYQEGSEYFVYEADEFDKNFLHYKPFASIITNIDYDHPDTYPTKSNYYEAFNSFAKLVKESIVIWSDSSKLLTTIAETNSTLDLVSLNKKDILICSELSQIKLIGEHNRQNAQLSIYLLEKITKQNKKLLSDYINIFPGTQRRFEKIRENIYSDYAHHPTEIAATLQLARELSNNIVVVYQPHQNVRQHQIKELYKHCFDLAAKVYWLPTYLSREDESLKILTPQELVSYVKHKDKIIISDLDNQLKSNLFFDLSNNYIILAMGAGSVDDWMRNNLT